MNPTSQLEFQKEKTIPFYNHQFFKVERCKWLKSPVPFHRYFRIDIFSRFFIAAVVATIGSCCCTTSNSFFLSFFHPLYYPEFKAFALNRRNFNRVTIFGHEFRNWIADVNDYLMRWWFIATRLLIGHQRPWENRCDWFIFFFNGATWVNTAIMHQIENARSGG